MDDLIRRLTTETGIDRAAAEKAVSIIFEFVLREGPADEVQPLLAGLPGADALMQRAGGEGGVAPAGGMMGAGMRMMSAGLTIGQVQSVSRTVLDYARRQVGEETVAKVVSGIPGLAEFV
jgi:hypothetical protein